MMLERERDDGFSRCHLPILMKARSSDDASSSSISSGDEMVTAPAIRSPPTQKGKDNTTQSNARPAKRARRVVAPEFAEGTHANPSHPCTELFKRLSSSSKAVVNGQVDNWIASYHKNADESLIFIANFLLLAAGFKTITISPQDVREVHGVPTELLTNAMKSESIDDKSSPLVDRSFQSFSSNYELFIANLTKKMGQSNAGTFFGEDNFFDKLFAWYAAASSSSSRSLRRAGTISALALLEGLCDSLRLKQKEAQNKNVSTAAQELMHVIEMHITAVFQAVFAHRYRDVAPDIRCACLNTLGNCTLSLPHFFLQDKFLKYFGWCLNDKHDSVRLAVIKQLRRLYATPGNIASLSSFSQRFNARMVECTQDKSLTVAESAIVLCTLLADAGAIEEEEDQRRVCNLMFERHHGSLRKKAGSFATVLLLKHAGKHSQVDVIMSILGFLENDAALRDVPAYCVDALWEEAIPREALSSLPALLSLIQEDGQGILALPTEAITTVLRVLLASVKLQLGLSPLDWMDASVILSNMQPGFIGGNTVAAVEERTSKWKSIAQVVLLEWPGLLRTHGRHPEHIQLLLLMLPLLAMVQPKNVPFFSGGKAGNGELKALLSGVQSLQQSMTTSVEFQALSNALTALATMMRDPAQKNLLWGSVEDECREACAELAGRSAAVLRSITDASAEDDASSSPALSAEEHNCVVALRRLMSVFNTVEGTKQPWLSFAQQALLEVRALVAAYLSGSNLHRGIVGEALPLLHALFLMEVLQHVGAPETLPEGAADPSLFPPVTLNQTQLDALLPVQSDLIDALQKSLLSPLPNPLQNESLPVMAWFLVGEASMWQGRLAFRFAESSAAALAIRMEGAMLGSYLKVAHGIWEQTPDLPDGMFWQVRLLSSLIQMVTALPLTEEEQETHSKCLHFIWSCVTAAGGQDGKTLDHLWEGYLQQLGKHSPQALGAIVHGWMSIITKKKMGAARLREVGRRLFAVLCGGSQPVVWQAGEQAGIAIVDAAFGRKYGVIGSPSVAQHRRISLLENVLGFNGRRIKGASATAILSHLSQVQSQAASLSADDTATLKYVVEELQKGSARAISAKSPSQPRGSVSLSVGLQSPQAFHATQVAPPTGEAEVSQLLKEDARLARADAKVAATSRRGNRRRGFASSSSEDEEEEDSSENAEEEEEEEVEVPAKRRTRRGVNMLS